MYRLPWPLRPPYDEEELWRALDEALSLSMTNPDGAMRLAHWVAMDAADFPDVRTAVEAFLDVLAPQQDVD